MQKLKRVVIKEELVALTGNFQDAVILNQLLYWSERIKDIDKFISEEKERALKHGTEINVEPQNGWIYKKAEELIEETMLGISPQTLTRIINRLSEKGYVYERNNPNYKWDRTKQYRVDLIKIKEDLQSIGYCLQGYKFDDATSKMEDGNSNMENQSLQNGRAIPEITSEITSETTNQPDRMDEILASLEKKFGKDIANIALSEFKKTKKAGYHINNIEAWMTSICQKESGQISLLDELSQERNIITPEVLQKARDGANKWLREGIMDEIIIASLMEYYNLTRKQAEEVLASARQE